MTFFDAMFIVCLWSIWGVLLYWSILGLGAVRYYFVARRELRSMPALGDNAPMVSVLVPAHNEAAVIENTIHAIAAQDYPAERFEIIIVNDGSTDDTAAIIDRAGQHYPNVRRMDVPVGHGGKGKSRTLNIGLQDAGGELVCIFDADNTPETNCLRRLVGALLQDKNLVAVNGKVRTRNHSVNWLTRFINLEFIYFQWLFQGGRWQWFRLSMLMGTGYVMYRDAIDILGGFDETSLVDDTEMSLRIFSGRRRIRWVPYATTWEQEPDDVTTWLKQRTRWSQGNMSVVWRYLPDAIANPFPMGLELFTFIINYVLLLPALLTSDIVFVAGVTSIVNLTLNGPYLLLWLFAFLTYMAHIGFAIWVEDRRWSNVFLAFLSYFTYAQLFVVVLARAIYSSAKQKLTGSELVWVKTSRKKENSQ